MLPLVAIIGRPNVGKSSLFNRMIGKRVSIVDPTPGVTRDRITTLLEVRPPEDAPEGSITRLVDLADTGGYGIYTAEGGSLDDAGCDLSRLSSEVESQIHAALREATVILFVIDAQVGLVALDRAVAGIIRKGGFAGRTIMVANKVDDHSWAAAASEAGKFGLGEVHCVSATSGLGVRGLKELIWVGVGEPTPEAPRTEMNLAIVGRRNAGKSSLVNAMAGQPRVIVSEIAGTTRDSIDVRFEADGRIFVAIDTAGVRKQRSWADDVEFYSHTRTGTAIKRADVCILLLDATEKVSQVEKKLAMDLMEQYKPTVVVLNKWDLVDKNLEADSYLKYLTQELPELSFAPIVCVSAKTGEGVEDAVRMAFNLHTQAGHRETTGKLNAVVQEILTARGPSSKLGTIAKIYYITQIAIRPPTIAMVVNKPKLFEGQYERYLLNRLRDELPFSEVPVRLTFSARKARPHHSRPE
ncbi:MAG: ribosome biogenesis GTPase Der [Phycisphaerales bacterium]|nr:ribosome biogenesis GTPase Der [Phycisphaerales bacterium]